MERWRATHHTVEDDLEEKSDANENDGSEHLTTLAATVAAALTNDGASHGRTGNHEGGSDEETNTGGNQGSRDLGRIEDNRPSRCVYHGGENRRGDTDDDVGECVAIIVGDDKNVTANKQEKKEKKRQEKRIERRSSKRWEKLRIRND